MKPKKLILSKGGFILITKEIWKDIQGYEGVYQISNLGEIKSLERMIVTNDNITKKIKEKY